MVNMTRQDEIQDCHRDYEWLYSLMLGIAVLGIGIWIGVLVGSTHFADRRQDFDLNLFTEAIGVISSIGFTVLVIDRLNERQATQRLIREAGSRSNDIAISAVEELRRKGRLTGATGLLKGAMLKGVNLSSSMLERANLQNSVLQDANLSVTNLRYANLSSASLERANLEGADLKFATLQFADLQEATLQNASMQNSHLLNAKLVRADVRNACLHDTDLRNAKFDLVNLSGAVLFRANLHGASFVWANLRGTNFQAADMRTANLHGADLSEANLFAVYLEGAILSGDIKLEGATLPDGTDYTDEADMARFTERTHPDFDETLAIVNTIRRQSGYDIS